METVGRGVSLMACWTRRSRRRHGCMTVELIEGPAWTGFGLQESAGPYPLRVETAMFSHR